MIRCEKITAPPVRAESTGRAGASRLAQVARRFGRTMLAAAFPALLAVTSQAQVLFSDDFTGASLDPVKWRVSNRPFESGITDIVPSVGGGYLSISGTDTAGWWGGASVATVPTFKASAETNLIFEVDRVSDYGIGTASRSGIWITDANRQKFVFFGDNRGEGNWRYNRKIGAPGDNPTGTGSAIPAFTDPTYTSGGTHRIKVIANGQTLRLFLDDVFGAEVAFPVSEGIVFEIAGYARAVNDTVEAVFANAVVRGEQPVLFTTPTGAIQSRAEVLASLTSTNIAVKIPAGSNASQPFTVRVTTSDPSVVLPVGASGDTVTVTFATGASTTKEVPVKALKNGVATLTLSNDAGVLVGNELRVLVPYTTEGVLFEDTFSGSTYDTTKWTLNTQGFEAGVGDLTVSTSDGQLKLTGGLAVQYWGGASLKTARSFLASPDMPLVFEVDRVALNYTGTAARTGVYVSNADRSQWLFFGQNRGESRWAVNTSAATPTGGGTTIAAFDSKDDAGAHKIRLEVDGNGVDIYLDDVYGGRYPLNLATGIHFEVGAYARAEGDTLEAAFDNVKISAKFGQIAVTPAVVAGANETDQQVTVTVPASMLRAGAAKVDVISQDPSVAVPTGATNGKLTLNFAAGGANSQTFKVTPVGMGTTTFELASEPATSVANDVRVTVTESLFTLLSDEFAGNAADTTKWKVDERGLERLATVTNDSWVAISNGSVNIHVVAAGQGEVADMWWGGLGLTTLQTYSASQLAPVYFEVDRLSRNGAGAEHRTAILISDADRQNWVMFSDDELNGGWVVNTSTGTLRQTNPEIPAFGDPKYRDGGLHRMKLLADGSTVKVYLDGVLGAEVPFTAQNLVFTLGAYARGYPDAITASFDNARVVGPIPPIRNSPASVLFEASQTTNEVVTLTVPAQLHETKAVQVTVTSSNPSVAVPVGGNNGSLTLTFAAKGADSQTFQVARVGTGTATFTFSNDSGVASTNLLTVAVQNSQPKVLATDNFDSASLSSLWQVTQGFRVEAEHVNAAADATVTSGSTLDFNVNVIANYWPGLQITTTTNYKASLTEPLTVEIDRSAHWGAGTGTRAGVYIYAGTNFVWFGENPEGTAGWGYNYEIGVAGDAPTGGAVQIAALNTEIFRDYANHRIKMVANGQTVALYLDGTFGAEIPFPFSSGLTIGIMGAGRAEGDTLTASFDNLLITGSDKIVTPAKMTIANQGGNVVVTWSGEGTLQQTDSFTGTWTDVPAASSPYTVPGSSLAQQKFYRLRY